MNITSALDRNSRLGIIMHWLGIFLLILTSQGNFSSPWTWLIISSILIFFIGIEVWTAKPRLSAHDLNLWTEIEEKCFGSPFLSFLDSHDFSSSFRENEIYPLRELGHYTRNDTYFINRGIEKDFKDIQVVAAELNRVICMQYMPVGNETGVARLSQKRKEDPQVKKDIEKMNELSEKLYPKMLKLRNTIIEYKQKS